MIRPRLHLALLSGLFIGSTLFLGTSEALAATCCKCKPTSDSSKASCMTVTKDGFDPTTQCKTLASIYPSNEALKSLTCEPMDCGAIKKITDGGTCATTDLPETYGVSATTATEKTPAITPELSVKIPGLHFSTQLKSDGGVIEVPFLAEYIAAVYAYLLGISVLVAAIMMIFGGFKYVLGSTFATISSGKKTVTDALIGLVLLFSSYTLLSALNPATVAPQTLNITTTTEKAYTIAAEERARVIAAATVPPSTSETSEESEDGTTPTKTASTPAAGTVVQDAQGNYVAQGNCPSDMIAIRHSDTYTRDSKLKSFCIDKYEAPNKLGEKPFVAVLPKEADWYCKAAGKRLCERGEWERACLGPQGKQKYGYGDKFIEGRWVNPPGNTTINPEESHKDPVQAAPCNYDTKTPGRFSTAIQEFGVWYPVNKPEDSVLVRSDISVIVKGKNLYEAMKASRQDMNGTEPSGSRSTCVTGKGGTEGVFDMVGNVAEIVVSNSFKGSTSDQRTATKPGTMISGSPYSVMNFYWSPIPHLPNEHATPECTYTSGGVHPIDYRTIEDGFRCCMNLDSN